MTELLQKAYDHEITPEEEAVLDKLEAEWLAMCYANELESYDYYSMSKEVKGSKP